MLESSSTLVALVWVAVSICAMVRFTWSTPEACSWLAALISAMMSATFFTLAAMPSSLLPETLTRWLPSPTFSRLSWIRLLISLAAAALRCARLRTSAATTAKPRPCSPARAASTAAFSASRLV